MAKILLVVVRKKSKKHHIKLEADSIFSTWPVLVRSIAESGETGGQNL